MNTCEGPTLAWGSWVLIAQQFSAERRRIATHVAGSRALARPRPWMRGSHRLIRYSTAPERRYQARTRAKSSVARALSLSLGPSMTDSSRTPRVPTTLQQCRKSDISQMCGHFTSWTTAAASIQQPATSSTSRHMPGSVSQQRATLQTAILLAKAGSPGFPAYWLALSFTLSVYLSVTLSLSLYLSLDSRSSVRLIFSLSPNQSIGRVGRDMVLLLDRSTENERMLCMYVYVLGWLGGF
ncbi:hypothetical protein F5Y09DRAFT_232762 [Xylaria sp. FL1042]|nr:hypothetical protein F5Y09DRAFT_232762 [Xylaria sp. FL1042]